MSEAGWVQWEPGQKHHYVTKGEAGWFDAACGAWSADGLGYRKLQDNIPEKKKCKLCLRSLGDTEA